MLPESIATTPSARSNDPRTSPAIHGRDHRQLGIDALAFVAAFLAYGFANRDLVFLTSIFFLFVLAYVASDFLLPPRYGFVVKFALLTLTIGLSIGVPALVQISARTANPASMGTHDGLVQTEEAARFLLAGKNPYVENYDGTPMSLVPFRIGNIKQNPALFHIAYLPFTFEFLAPFLYAFEKALGWFDGRVVLLPMLAGLLLLAGRLTSDRHKRYAMVIALAFNPFFVTFVAEGRNDVFVLFWIVLGALLLRSGHESWSLVALGLACSSKWTAWFLIPFYLVYLMRPPQSNVTTWLHENAVKALTRILPLLVTIALLVGPFAVWNPGAFVDDVWSYPNGTSVIAPYPLNGFGFNQLMMIVTGIPGDSIHSPFEFLQWIVGIPLLAALLYRQWKSNTIPNMWLSFALLTGAMGYFSHVFNDNHVGFTLSLVVLAFLTSNAPPHEVEQSVEPTRVANTRRILCADAPLEVKVAKQN